MSKKIFIDYDTTLVDFLGTWVRKINEAEGTNLTPFEMGWGLNEALKKKHIKMFTENDIYKYVPPFKNSRKFLEKLKRMGFDVILITANGSDEQIGYKEKHIEKHYNGIFQDIIHSSDKHLYTKEGNLVDDNYRTVIKHIKETGQEGLLFNHGGNYVNTDNFDLSVDKLTHHQSYKSIIELINEREQKIETSRKIYTGIEIN